MEEKFTIYKSVPATREEYLKQCKCFLSVTEKELEKEFIRHNKKVIKLRKKIIEKKKRIKDLEV